MNHNSSRSHCIFSVTIHVKECTDEGQELLKVGKLNLVDLAGSENVARSGAVKERKTEAGMINKSLLTLGRVINALVDRTQHIPYRESKLTRLLQDSLGGKTKTCIIATISPASLCLDETINTLEYAYRAKNIRNQPQVNRKLSKKQVCETYSIEIDDLKTQLMTLRRESGVYLPQSQYDKMTAKILQRTEKIKELEGQIALREVALKEAQQQFDVQEAKLVETQTALAETESTLSEASQRLTHVQQTLKTVTEDLNEHKHVLEEHVQTEQKFHGQADVVLSTMEGTLQEVAGLHQKIDRQANLEKVNTQNIQQFREQIALRMGHTQQHVKQYVNQQTTKYGQIRQTINQVLPEKQKEFAQLENRVKQLQESIRLSSAQLSQLKKDQQNTIKTQTDAFNQLHQQQQSQMIPKIDGLITTLPECTAEFKGLVNTHAKQKSEWTTQFNQDVTKDGKLTHQQLQNQTNGLQQLTKQTNQNLTNDVNQMEKDKEALNLFFTSQKQQMAQFQDLMINEFNRLVQQFVSQRNELIEAQKSNLTNNIQKHIQDHRGLQDTVDTDVTAMNTNVQLFDSHINTLTEGILKATATNSQNTTTFSSQICSQADNASDAMVNGLKGLNMESEAFMTSMQREVNNNNESQLLLTNQHTSITISMENQIDTLGGKIIETMDQSKLQLQQNIGTWGKNLQDTQHLVGGFYSQYTTIDPQQQVQQFKLGAYTPTGSTPVKKDYPYQKNLSRPKPDEAIITQFHSQPSNTPPPEPLKHAIEEAQAHLDQINRASTPPNEPIPAPTLLPPSGSTNSPLIKPTIKSQLRENHNSPSVLRTKSLLSDQNQTKPKMAQTNKPTLTRIQSNRKGIKEITNNGSS